MAQHLTKANFGVVHGGGEALCPQGFVVIFSPLWVPALFFLPTSLVRTMTGFYFLLYSLVQSETTHALK